MANFEHLINRRENGSMKWDNAYILKRFGLTETEDIYPLFISDMDFKLDETIMQKFIEFIQGADFGYFLKQTDLYTAVQNWLFYTNKTTVAQEEIIFAPGTLSALHMLVAALAADSHVAVFPPVYGHFENAITPHATMHTIPLLLIENQYQIDYATFEEKIISKEITCLLFCNPHNPSGKNWSYKELEELVHICKKYDVTILSDEIHADLDLKDSFVSMYQFIDNKKKIAISTSGNKLFNISGLNSSYVITKIPEIKNALEQILAAYHVDPNRVGLAFMQICLEHGASWREELLAHIQANIVLTQKYLTHPSLTIMEPDSGYLVWVKVENLVDVDKVVIDLAQETGVLVETGSRFITNYKSCFRINIATSTEHLTVALERIQNFTEKYLK